MKKMNIVKSSTEPDINNIWLKDGKLMAYTAQGWKALTTEGGGGSGKETVDLYLTLPLGGGSVGTIRIGKDGEELEVSCVSDTENGANVIRCSNQNLKDILHNHDGDIRVFLQFKDVETEVVIQLIPCTLADAITHYLILCRMDAISTEFLMEDILLINVSGNN